MAEATAVKNPLFAVFKLNANNIEGYTEMGGSLESKAVYSLDGNVYIRVDFTVVPEVIGKDEEEQDILTHHIYYLNVSEFFQSMTEELYNLYDDAKIVECIRYNHAPAKADHGPLDPDIIAQLKGRVSFVEVGIVK
ncbi:hypothetical protein [Ewingella americana]|uniref:Uncharacterized protein n=1 Tax=Ewingella americana TaxID=41202 RepID=A0A502GE80_9GAMM|nr:hypothetical protein [Ewingella americana]TPG59932.1 hypothetical protein EAH77_15305 [Ewingella americana]